MRITLCVWLVLITSLLAAPVPAHRENRVFDFVPGVYEVRGDTDTTPIFRMTFYTNGRFILKATSTWEGFWLWHAPSRTLSFIELESPDAYRPYHYKLDNDLKTGKRLLVPESKNWYDEIRIKRLRNSR